MNALNGFTAHAAVSSLLVPSRDARVSVRACSQPLGAAAAAALPDTTQKGPPPKNEYDLEPPINGAVSLSSAAAGQRLRLLLLAARESLRLALWAVEVFAALVLESAAF